MPESVVNIVLKSECYNGILLLYINHDINQGKIFSHEDIASKVNLIGI